MTDPTPTNSPHQIALEEIAKELNTRLNGADFQYGIAQVAPQYYIRQMEYYQGMRDTLDWTLRYVTALIECADATKKIGDMSDPGT